MDQPSIQNSLTAGNPLIQLTLNPIQQFGSLEKENKAFLEKEKFELDFRKPEVKKDQSMVVSSLPLLGSGFISAFIASFSIIVMSELGDKTFFIAALMSMKYSALTVFSGGLSALALMTVLSAAVGSTLPKLIDRKYSHFASVILFFIFGFRMLYDAYQMESSKENEELVEVEEELNKKCDAPNSAQPDCGRSRLETPIPFGISKSDPLSLSHVYGSNGVRNSKRFGVKGFWSSWRLSFSWLSPVFLQAFSLTFVAEWGDRSQVATIALAASRNVWGVNIGAIGGHALCTGIAVIGGKMLASSISERAVTCAGGALFLVFGIAGVFFDV